METNRRRRVILIGLAIDTRENGVLASSAFEVRVSPSFVAIPLPQESLHLQTEAVVGFRIVWFDLYRSLIVLNSLVYLAFLKESQAKDVSELTDSWG
jgi:hypothetical protein